MSADDAIMPPRARKRPGSQAGERLSPFVALGATTWKRFSHEFAVDESACGFLPIQLLNHPARPIIDAEVVWNTPLPGQLDTGLQQSMQSTPQRGLTCSNIGLSLALSWGYHLDGDRAE